MLTYHPAFDLYHCIFRMLQLLTHMKQDEVEVDRLRIWDFFLVFPREAKTIIIPNSLKHLRQYRPRNEAPNPYEDLINPKRIIDRMKPYQLAALKCLASYGFIDMEALGKMIVVRTGKEIPQDLSASLLELTDDKLSIINIITGFRELPLYGLKEKTGLLEFRYDAR